MIYQYQKRYMTPTEADTALPEFLALIDAAEKEIRIGIYGFTWVELIDRLIAAKARGVDVEILFDHTQACGPTEEKQLLRMAEAGFVPGVDFWIGTSPQAGQITHWKVTIVDGAFVESGSFNYSLSAQAQINSLTLERNVEYAQDVLTRWQEAKTFIISHDDKYLEQFKAKLAAQEAKTATVTVPAGTEAIVTTPEADVAVAATEDTTVTIAPKE